ncbi:MAG: IS21 family transposition helper protein [candidate division NC10 bacterium]|nr:IS21 family transposition helper protein [candidate division NC10 bacterium]
MMMHPLLPKLRALRLSGMLETLDTRAAQASERNLTPTEFLAIMLDDELERRDQARLGRLVTEAGIDPGKTLAQFDFAAAPQINRTLVLELASCTFVHRGENVLFSGPTGTGKSHIGNALAWEAVKHNHTAYVRSAHRLLADLQTARANGTFTRRFARLCSVELLAIDDFGLRPLAAQGAEDLYELIRERYERKSLIITSNRAFQEWPDAFGEPLLASAALDRLTHHCHTLVITGQSYRQRGRSASGKEGHLDPTPIA